jgi:leucyl-tRNA synthetase
VIQVNGKLRSQITIAPDQSSQEAVVVTLAKNDANVAKWLEGKDIKKSIYVPGKLINFVVEV